MLSYETVGEQFILLEEIETFHIYKELIAIKNWKKQFAIIYTGQGISLLGSAAVQFAVIWWLTIQTESAITLTIASIAAFLPNLLIGPFAGVLIDRYNRRIIMIAADGLVAISSVILGLAFILTETPPIWFIYGILFLRGMGNTFHGPALQAAIPMLVPTEMLTKAGGWGNMVNSISSMLGPVLGAAMITFLPIASIMLVDIIGAIFAIVCLLFISIPNLPQSGEKTHLLSNLKIGLTAIRTNRPFFAAFGPMVLMIVLYMPLSSLFPLLVYSHFMGDAWHNSIVQFSFAAGLLTSSILIGVWGGMRRRFLMISSSVGLLGAAALISGTLPTTSTGFTIFVLCSFFMAGFGTFISVPFMAYAQESFAPEVLGKVFSLWFGTMSLAMPIGLLLAGPVSEIIGVDRWFFWSGTALIATALLCHLLTRHYD